MSTLNLRKHLFFIMELLNRIKEIGRLRGLTIAQIERGAGLNKTTLAKWNINAPSIDKVCAVADFFGISIDELIGRAAPALSAVDRQILDLVHELNEEGQGAALAMLQGLSRQPAYIKSHHDAEADLNAEA